ncbi:CGNR zinc finger domain-containing protein [Rhodococcus jostii]|nr:ABATE domain-containing protein [Rhodococcus jostii]
METKDQRRLGFPFRSGSLCLDFVATVAKRDMNDREMLVDAESLQTWFYVAGLPAAQEPLDESRLVDARDLREALNTLTRARVDGLRPAPAAVDILNSAASIATPAPVLAYDAGTVRPVDPVPVESVLSVVARDAIDLFSGEYKNRIRRCLGHECSLYFVDRSRQGARRWCSMAACGEKASSAAYRRRHGATR